MTPPEYPLSAPFNASFSVSVETQEDAGDLFELLCSDGKKEVYGIYDGLGRSVKLLKPRVNTPVVVEHDTSPPNPYKWAPSRTYKL